MWGIGVLLHQSSGIVRFVRFLVVAHGAGVIARHVAFHGASICGRRNNMLCHEGAVLYLAKSWVEIVAEIASKLILGIT